MAQAQPPATSSTTDYAPEAPKDPNTVAMEKISDISTRGTLTTDSHLNRLPEVVQKLWFGKKLFSKSFLADYWMVVRNNHILFSVILAHPRHPFLMRERIAILLATIFFGYGVASVAAFIWEAIMNACPECRDAVDTFMNQTDSQATQAAEEGGMGRPPLATRDLIMIVIAMIIQAVYDTSIRLLARCECAKQMDTKRRPKLITTMNFLQPFVGIIALGATAFLAVLIILPIMVRDLDKGPNSDWALSITALQTWAIARGVSWGGTAMVVLLIMTFFGRRKEFKRDFGKKRELYGWTHAKDLPKYPPDMCLFCSCMPGPCANTMAMGVLLGLLVGFGVGYSVGPIEGAFLGTGCATIIIGVGSAMIATSETATVMVDMQTGARPAVRV